MYNTSLRMVNDSYIAEDIMQEAFLTAFRNLKSFKWQSSFGSWLKRIVVNKSLDKIRAIHDTEQLNEDYIQDVVDVESEDADEEECKLTEIRENLQNVNPDYRILLVLYLFEGYDHQEMSEILNMTHANVRVKYHRAKRKLLDEIIKSRKVA